MEPLSDALKVQQPSVGIFNIHLLHVLQAMRVLVVECCCKDEKGVPLSS